MTSRPLRKSPGQVLVLRIEHKVVNSLPLFVSKGHVLESMSNGVTKPTFLTTVSTERVCYRQSNVTMSALLFITSNGNEITVTVLCRVSKRPLQIACLCNEVSSAPETN
jgi:hypothetical protein